MAQGPGEFERLVLPHLDAAYNLARWLVRDPASAEDVVQEAMLRAWRFHAGLRGEAKPWLLQIVRHVAYAMMAKRRMDVPIDEVLELADPAGTPEEAVARQQQVGQADAALAALPDELRECLVLRELEDLSYKEIAQVTGVAIGTVMSRLWRARRAIAGVAL